MKKCPNGMYSEIKYDGERVQVHKNGNHFSYFSRSLKPVLPHKVRTSSLLTLKIKSHRMFLYMFKTITIYFKEFDFLPQVAHFKDFIPQAFPGGQSMILDAEVLLIDTKTSKPLPFGTLGVHKVIRKQCALLFFKGLVKYT